MDTLAQEILEHIILAGKLYPNDILALASTCKYCNYYILYNESIRLILCKYKHKKLYNNVIMDINSIDFYKSGTNGMYQIRVININGVHKRIEIFYDNYRKYLRVLTWYYDKSFTYDRQKGDIYLLYNADVNNHCDILTFKNTTNMRKIRCDATMRNSKYVLNVHGHLLS
jgi:hypothetical protein